MTVAHLTCGYKWPLSFIRDNVSYSFTDYSFVAYPDYDVMIIDFPQTDDSGKHLPEFRDISHHFVRDDDRRQHPEYLCRLEQSGNLTSSVRVSGPDLTVSYQVNGSMISVPHCYSLRINSIDGDCGLLYLNEEFAQIQAQHNSGTGTGVGYARLITQEYLEFMLKGLQDKVSGQGHTIQEVALDSPSIKKNPFFIHCESRILEAYHWFDANGKVMNLTHLPEHSKQKENPHWKAKDDIPEIPAALTEKYGKSPVHEALKRLGPLPTPPPFNMEILNFCIGKVRDSCLPSNFRSKVLSVTEAYNGIRGLTPVHADTSDGLPSKLDNTILFTVTEKTGVRHPTPAAFAYDQELQEEMFHKFPFTFSLKDELLPRRKVSPELIKTRGYFAGSKPFNTHVKRYFGQTVAMMHRGHGNSYVKVGVPMGTFNTPTLVDDVMHVPTTARLLITDVASMDYSQYLDIAVHMLMEFFSPYIPKKHHDHMRKILRAALAPYIAFKRTVFRLSSIMPSGIFGTAEFNSIIRSIFELYVLYIEYGFAMLDNILFLHAYGDDDTTALDTEEVTLPGFIDAFKKHTGWTLTPGNKSEIIPDYYRPDEYQFLQRIYLNGRFVLLREKLFTAGRYYKGHRATAKQAIDSMLLEASFWGQSTFEEVLAYYQASTDYEVWPRFTDFV